MAARREDVKHSAEQMQEVRELMNLNRQLYGEPYRPYPHAMIAPMTKLQGEAEQIARAGSGYAPTYQRAEQMIGQAQQRFPDVYQRYRNPYEQEVVRGVMEDVNRNFRENVLPSLEAHFIRRGQHGSSKHREMANKAQRDMQSELLSKIGQIRAHGYERGAELFGAEQERQAKLAELMASLGGRRQASQIAEAGLLSELGAAQQQHRQNMMTAAHNEFLREQAFPYERLSRRAAIFHGMPYPTTAMMQFMQPAQPELNRAGNIGALAGALLAARHRGMGQGGGGFLGGLFG